jgi:hypothetical protein
MLMEQGNNSAMKACWKSTVNACQQMVDEAEKQFSVAGTGKNKEQSLSDLTARKFVIIMLYYLHARDIVERLVEEKLVIVSYFMQY